MWFTENARELIGRAAALVLALALLAGAYGLGRTASWARIEEQREAERLQSVSRYQRRTQISMPLWIGCGLLGIGGIGVATMAILPNRILYKIRPSAPKLLENPEPGQCNRF
jgi:hypothetical protein